MLLWGQTTGFDKPSSPSEKAPEVRGLSLGVAKEVGAINVSDDKLTSAKILSRPKFDAHQLGRVGAKVFDLQRVRVLLIEVNLGQAD